LKAGNEWLELSTNETRGKQKQNETKSGKKESSISR
jgi:hypothetical protein